MKAARLLLLLCVLVCWSGCGDREVSSHQTVANATRIADKVIRESIASARAEILTKLQRLDPEIYVEVADSTFAVRSSKLSDFQILQALNPELERLHSAGVDKITITDRSGSVRDVDLTIIK